METMINDEGLKSLIVDELREFGCCYLCILRYLGNTEPHMYRRGEDAVREFLLKERNGVAKGDSLKEEVKMEVAEEPVLKSARKSPCVACVGLLERDYGTCEAVLNQVASAVKDANIQAKSYTVNLTLPISVQFRAYFVWFHLMDRFPKIYQCFPNMKPEGVCLKNAWKWICTGVLKEKVDPESEWGTDGSLLINITLNYEDNEAECQNLRHQLRSISERRSKSDILSRTGVDTLFKDMGTFEFNRKFGSSPPAASKYLSVCDISCNHVPIYIAGRYCKLSRNVSQTPWIIDGQRYHDGSVEELISAQVLSLTNAEQEKFSASGREDVDVRMLGRGRPFRMEVINPKRTLLTKEDMTALRKSINSSTTLISVRDIQLVEKKDAAMLKEGEENKCKTYCALCMIPDGEVTKEILEKLNNIPVPLVLQQRTPTRVLHRRSLATRERSVYSIKAVPAKSKNLFKLYVQTQAGTYVKEFVHGDLGRTRPSIAEILECDADIVSLDVESIDFPWPPTIDDD